MIVSPTEAHDGLIVSGLSNHYDEALQNFDETRIVGLFCQGSQNYGLDYENSDLDTKLIVLPTFEDIAFNRKPISTTHVRANNEHIDMKDLRLYFGIFQKQNLNFLEILFTPYYILNSEYKKEWNKLVEAREKIAHMNPYRAVMSMYGVAQEKYHAMKHEYPSKVNIIAQYGYDGKQVHHLLRVENFLERYIADEPYEECMRPTSDIIDKLMAYKRQEIPLNIAEVEAETAINHIIQMRNDFCAKHKDEIDPETIELLNEVQYNIMRHSIAIEFLNDEVYD